MQTRPEVGFIRPVRILSVVVLPAAFGPSMAKNSPRGMVSEMSLTAVRSPNFFTRLTSSITNLVLGFVPFVEHGGNAVGEFDAQNFAERADVNDNWISEYVRFQAINIHRFAVNRQPFTVRFPMKILHECG